MPTHRRGFQGNGNGNAPNWSQHADPTIDRRIGKLFGNYRLLEVLGSGGMGTVYLAKHELTEETAAVKVLTHGSIQNNSTERFIREARLAKRVQHPNVVQFIDVGQAENELYIVMEYVGGKGLDTELGAGPLSWERAQPILMQICDALQAIHKQSIVHRDLKPGNIMLVEQENGTDLVRLFDFGIAKPFADALMEPGMQLTEYGIVPGTVGYMSPESAQGHEVDHRTDIYALGSMMYEMFTGKPPFEADTPQRILIQHATEAIVPPSQKFPDLGIYPELEAIIMRAVERNPDERFQSAADMREAIATCTVQRKKPFLDGDDSLIDEALANIRKRFPWNTAGIIATVALAAFAGFLVLQPGDREPAKKEAAAIVEKPIEADGGTMVAAAKDAGVKKEVQESKEVEDKKSNRWRISVNEAIDLITDYVTRSGQEDNYTELVRMGERIVPALIRMIETHQLGNDELEVAVSLLEDIGDPRAVPILETVERDMSDIVQVDVDALLKMALKGKGPRAIERSFRGYLRKRSRLFCGGITHDDPKIRNVVADVALEDEEATVGYFYDLVSMNRLFLTSLYAEESNTYWDGDPHNRRLDPLLRRAYDRVVRKEAEGEDKPIPHIREYPPEGSLYPLDAGVGKEAQTPDEEERIGN